MKFVTKIMAAALPGLLVAGGAAAHHGWGSYDAAAKFTITSPIERLQWQNPHVQVDVQHAGKSWAVVLAPPFRMDARELKVEMIKPGTSVAIEGYPSTKGEPEMRAERITVAGRVFELR